MAESLWDLLPSFQRELRAIGRSEKTIRTHSQAIRFFAEWLPTKSLPATADSLLRERIRDWLSEQSEKVETNTLRTRYMGLSRFCRWCVDEGVLPKHPMTTLEAPKAAAPPVPIITDAELAALLKACAGKRYYDRRDEAIIRLLIDCGTRVSELCALTVKGLDLDNEMALVTGKGDRVRPVYFGARTSRSLDRYLRARRQHRWAHLPDLWLGERGAMTPDGIRELVRVRAEKAGLEHTWPHKFRHTFAHDFLLAGGQERDLKRLAGWTSDIMLERYGASAADIRARAAAKNMRRGDRV